VLQALLTVPAGNEHWNEKVKGAVVGNSQTLLP